ncbi:cell envelope integrity protein TolA [Candidatus Curculioniphilus buchneri]|uniref:cell envelope integrity protein TolA n=1 Tax=Candidatus Curculioniphilus buchneri TaxID=690594 RepID=UPI00376F39F9
MMLHFILVIALIYRSIYRPKEINKYRSNIAIVNAVMVNPDKIIQQHYYENHLDHQQSKQLKNTLLSEKKGLTELNKHHFSMQKIDKPNQNNQVKKKQVEISKNIQRYQKKLPKVTVQVQSTDNVKKQTIVELSKQTTKKVDDLLNELTDIKNFKKIKNKPYLDINKRSNARSEAIDFYKTMIKNEIKKNFYDYTSFLGKTCHLKMTLTPDGTLLSITSVNGDLALCQAAITAAKAAQFPRPPDLQVYEVFKDAILEFVPQ